MKDLMITAYSGFSTVSGETNLTTVITNIRNGAYFHTVRKVEQQLRLGDLSKANAIKKQLPFLRSRETTPPCGSLTACFATIPSSPWTWTSWRTTVWMPSAVA